MAEVPLGGLLLDSNELPASYWHPSASATEQSLSNITCHRSCKKVSSLGAELLRWYDDRRRDLPWRRSRDPYAIWVSEIMLQQTQVATVFPFYEKFLERFPTVSELAAAEIEEVLALWSGLGYYRRARQLHAAAVQVAALGAELPTTAEELRRLPGIGPYTAAAIASIAFGEHVAVLDGNVERVLCRFLALAGDPKKSTLRRQLVETATGLLVRGRPGDSNQALMELGATLCRSQQADCSRCPLASVCRARLNQQVELYPTPRRRRRMERVELAVVVVEERGRVLLFRRPSDAELLAGLWELPTVTMHPRRKQLEAELEAHYGGRWRLKGKATERIRHSITHRAISAWIYSGELSASESVAEGPEAAWVDPLKRDQYPVSSLVDKVLKSWVEQSGQQVLKGV